MSTEERITELYGVPLNDFVTARNDLARELKDEGLEDDSKRVRALAKPSVAAWTVNQLSRSFPDEIDALLALRERLRAADSANDLREASAKRHQTISDLVDKAADILRGTGNAASSQTLAKVSGTLYGTASDEDRDALKRGTLARELEAAGFEDASDLDWSVAVPVEPEGTSSTKTAKAQAEREQLEAELEEAEKSAKELGREAKRARRAAEAAESQAETALGRAERLRAKLERD